LNNLETKNKGFISDFCVSGYGAHLNGELHLNDWRYKQRQVALNLNFGS